MLSIFYHVGLVALFITGLFMIVGGIESIRANDHVKSSTATIIIGVIQIIWGLFFVFGGFSSILK